MAVRLIIAALAASSVAMAPAGDAQAQPSMRAMLDFANDVLDVLLNTTDGPCAPLWAQVRASSDPRRRPLDAAYDTAGVQAAMACWLTEPRDELHFEHHAAHVAGAVSLATRVAASAFAGAPLFSGGPEADLALYCRNPWHSLKRAAQAGMPAAYTEAHIAGLISSAADFIECCGRQVAARPLTPHSATDAERTMRAALAGAVDAAADTSKLLLAFAQHVRGYSVADELQRAREAASRGVPAPQGQQPVAQMDAAPIEPEL